MTLPTDLEDAWRRLGDLHRHQGAMGLSWRRGQGVPSGDVVRLWCPELPNSPVSLDVVGRALFGPIPTDRQHLKPVMVEISTILAASPHDSADLLRHGLILNTNSERPILHAWDSVDHTATRPYLQGIRALPEGWSHLLLDASAHTRIETALRRTHPVLPAGDLAPAFNLRARFPEILAWRQGDRLAAWTDALLPPVLLVP